MNEVRDFPPTVEVALALDEDGRANGTVFWRVAALLIGSLVALVILAVMVSGWLAMDRSLDLIENSLQLRLDSVAEEIELRGHLEEGFTGVSESLLIDLASRFEDSVYLFDSELGLRRISVQGVLVDSTLDLSADVIRAAREALARDTLVIELAKRGKGGFALAPVYDEAGFQVGGLLVSPLAGTVAAELAGPRAGYVRALWIVAILAFVVALGLGSYVSWLVIRPLRSITMGVEAIGGGEYARRLDLQSNDEFGRLAGSVDKMAESVRQSMTVLQDADTARRQMVANMGHDLRTPLTAMLGYLEEAIRYAREGRSADLSEALNTAESQGKRLQQLVEDLFELSILDSVPPSLKREPVPIGELLHEVARTHRGQVQEVGIRFVVDIPEGLPVVMADGNRLLRMLNNVLSNARNHTPDGGTVALSAMVAEDMLHISVTDTGSGLDADEVEMVFERYARGKSARTRSMTGTGLGLAIGRAIARAHGGELIVESEPGNGATFTFSLKLSPK